MRILAISDIHGGYDVVDRILYYEKEYDVVVIAGDLTTHGTPDEAETAIRHIMTHGKQLICVVGNMDSREIEDRLEHLYVLVDETAEIAGNVAFFGVSGCPETPMHTPYELSEEEILSRAEKGWQQASQSAIRVFVPHAPPYKTKVDKIFLGKHVGSRSVRSIIEKYQPDVVICGHIHEASGQDTIGKSKIVNCGPAHNGYYAMIEIGEEIRIENKRL